MDDRNRESLSALMDGEASEIELRRLLSREDASEMKATWQRYHTISKVLKGGQEDQLGLTNLDISDRISSLIENEPALTSLHFNEEDNSHEPKPVSAIAEGELADSDAKQMLSEKARLEAAIATSESVVPFVDRRKQADRRQRQADNVKHPEIPGWTRHQHTKTSASSMRRFGRLVMAASVLLAVALWWWPQHDGSDLMNASPESLAADLFARSEAQPMLAMNQDFDATEVVTEDRVKRMNEYLLRHAENSTFQAGQSLLPLTRLASFNAAPPVTNQGS